jgi:hypothetical protein
LTISLSFESCLETLALAVFELDFLFEKGVFKAVQSAIFYEIGQVSPADNDALYSGFKYSTGVGLRLVFSSVVLRADYATGKEGQETTVFIGYGF